VKATAYIEAIRQRPDRLAHSRYGKPDAYFGLLDELRSVLGTDVDLVMVGALKNRYVDRGGLVPAGKFQE
jgi:hypothetical protein